MAPNLWPDLVLLSSFLSWRFSSRFGFGYEKTSDFLKDFIIYLVQQSISGQNLGHSDCYFFENPSIGSKFMKIFVLRLNSLPNICNFRWNRWIWRCYSYFWRWNRLTFEPVDGFSKFKNVNWSEFNFKETLFSSCFWYDEPFPIYCNWNMCLCCITS